MNCFEITAQQGIRVDIGAETHVLPSDSIAYIEYLGRKVVFHLADGAQVSTSTLRVSFAHQVEPILALPKFVCVHRSFVVNLDYVRAIGSNDVLMESGKRLPIARSKHGEVLLKFSCWHDYNNPDVHTPYFLLEKLPVGSCVFQISDRRTPIMTFCSNSVCAHMGYTREELIRIYGGDPFLTIHPDDRPKYLMKLAKLHDGCSVRADFRLQCKQGGYLRTMTIAHRLAEGEKISFYIVFLFEDSGAGSSDADNSLDAFDQFFHSGAVLAE